MNEIVKNLYQGNLDDAIRATKEKSVDWIVWLSQGIPQELSHQCNVSVIHIPMKDGVDLKEKWEVANAIIAGLMGKDVEEQNLLIACRGGISRSPMMVALYLYYEVPEYMLCFDETLKFVRQKIPQFQPEQSLLKMVKEMCEE